MEPSIPSSVWVSWQLDADPQPVTVRYAVTPRPELWELKEETVPESRPHDLACELLRALLEHWAARQAGRILQVGRNLAVRWDPDHPRVGVDPDLYVVEPPPPEGDAVTSLCTWKPGHHPPALAVEVVSPQYAHKDYLRATDKYAVCGVGELWVFDPFLAGPGVAGGPHRIQLWRRDATGSFGRVYAGPGPARSPALGAWLFATSEGQLLRLADDPDGTSWWMTPAEAERAEKERERAEKETALARVAALEAALAARDRDPA